MTGHFIQICLKCDKTISQCYCLDQSKEVFYGICEACVRKAAGSAQKEDQSKDLSKITDLTGKLHDLLTDPSPGIAAWHEAVGILMRKLRDELNVVLNTTPTVVKTYGC